MGRHRKKKLLLLKTVLNCSTLRLKHEKFSRVFIMLQTFSQLLGKPTLAPEVSFSFFLLGASLNRREKLKESGKQETHWRQARKSHVINSVENLNIWWVEILQEKVLLIKLIRSCHDVRRILTEVFWLLYCQAWLPALVLAVFQKTKYVNTRLHLDHHLSL